MESSDVFWREPGERAQEIPPAQDEREQGDRGRWRESLLDLQSLIDRLFIDLV